MALDVLTCSSKINMFKNKFKDKRAGKSVSLSILKLLAFGSSFVYVLISVRRSFPFNTCVKFAYMFCLLYRLTGL